MIFTLEQKISKWSFQDNHSKMDARGDNLHFSWKRIASIEIHEVRCQDIDTHTSIHADYAQE